MNTVLHIALVFSYAAACGSIAVLAARESILTGVEAALASSMAFLALGVFHVVFLSVIFYKSLERRYNFMKQQIVYQTNSFDELEERLNETRGEIHDETKRQSEELMGEVRVLQSLLSQVVGRRQVGDEDVEQKDHLVEVQDEDRVFAVMRNALSENRIDLHVQPIVQLPSRKALYFECFARVRDEMGEVIFPGNFLDVAIEHGMSGTLDNLILFRCVQMIRKLGHRRPGVKFFCNISSASLTDASFFPQFVEFMLDNRELVDRLVFEFDYHEALGFSSVVLDDLARLARRGFRFSLDNVGALDFDMAMMKSRHVSFVKIDAGLLLAGHKSAIHAADLKAALRRYDIALIATRIETEEMVLEILDHNVDYAQGYLFGEPRQSRIETAPTEPVA